MNSLSKNNILVCFYGISYPSYLMVTSFDIDYNLNYLESYSTYMLITDFSIELIKSKNIDNQSTSLLCFFQKGRSPYTCVYNIDENNLTIPIKRAGMVGSSLKCLNFIYFFATQQFFFAFKNDNLYFEIVILNSNYELVRKCDYTIIKYYDCHRQSIIYSEKDNCYSMISDAKYSDGEYIRLFENITTTVKSNIINDNSSIEVKELYGENSSTLSDFSYEPNKFDDSLQLDNFTQIGQFRQSDQYKESEYYTTDNNLQTAIIEDSDEATFKSNQIVTDK
jgi:hypothetical protein